MSLKSIIATPLFLVLAAAAGAAEQTRQTTVVQDMATGAATQPGTYAGSHALYQDVAIPSAAKPEAKKVKAPSGGAKLPAVQKVRDAANRSQQADKHKGHIEVDSLSLGAVDSAAGRGSNHGGVVVGLADGSVRNSVSPVGGNETIKVGSNSTENAKGGGLGSLQGMNSIGQLAAPPGGDPAAGREVRHRSFAIVDRTQMSKDGANTGAVGGNKTQNIGIGRTETTAGGGPHVKGFSGSDGAGARGASGNITMKGQAIKQN